MRSRLTTLLLALGISLLAGCATNATKDTRSPESDILTADTILKPARPIQTEDGPSGISVSPNPNAHRPPPKPEIETGTGKFFKQQPAAPNSGGGEGQVTFNFENQPIQAVVKAILGDMLEENYTIAPNVGGNVTYSTSRPIRREDAMPVLEMLLSWTGNALVREGGRYTVLQSKEAIAGKLTPRITASQQPGYALRIFPLKYISASETAKLLKPYAKADAFVSIDPNRSLLVLAGTPSELDNYQRTIDTFDIDWMKGMSIGVFTMQHVEVSKLMPDLEKIFGTAGESPLAGMFRFMPIEQTNAIVVITPQPDYLKEAEEWLLRLDRGGAENSTQLYIYNVKNLKAPDLADYLSEIFLGTTGGSSRRSSTSGSVGPGMRSTTLGGGRSSLGGSGGSSMNYQNALRPQSSQEKSAPVAAASAPAAAGANGKKESDIRISAIEENNQLMIMAQPYEWEQIQSAVRKLDTPPLQVQIEARILEVTLSGDLEYGVQWWLGNLQSVPSGGVYDSTRGPYRYPNPYNRSGSTIGASGPPAAGQGAGSFFYSFINSKFQARLSALQTSALTKTLSAPSLVVNNNQEASLTVGSKVPINQVSLVGIGVTGNNANGSAASTGYSSVSYLDTGITLQVKPRVNPGGLVYLDISQQVSNPITVAGNQNPTVANREIQTQVAVQSGQTVLLGGLIKEDNGETKTGVPLLNKVPLLRDLFGNTSQKKNRTELIVLITPRVINNSNEAAQMTLDYSRQFESLAPLRAKGQPISNPPSPPPAAPADTYPVPENSKSQEDSPRDH